MRTLKRGFLYTACSAVVLCVPWPLIAQNVQARDGQLVVDHGVQDAVSSSPSATVQPNRSVTEVAAADVLPDSPGAAWAKNQESTSSQTSSTQADQGTQATTQEKPQRPVGTAAAEAPRVTGITAAEPAGVAIAPAKQHRVRIIVLKVGAIVGAGAALGTVIALTAGTSSKPPGAH